jgi:alkylhydroperoxidase family enzyme/mannose-6-phosphate isomerase-like protein (cupin superfamily)
MVVVNETAGDEATPEQAAGFDGKPELTNRWFRAYRVVLGPGDTTPSHLHTTPAVVFQATEGRAMGTGATKWDFNTPGQWAFFDAGDRHQIRNMGDGRIELIEVEVRGQIGTSAAGPRMLPVPSDRMTADQQSVAARFASSAMPNAVATYVHHPVMAERVLPYEQYIANQSTLPPRHRILLALRTAWLTRSAYLWAHGAGAAQRAGFTNDEVRRIAQGPDTAGWDPFEAVVLRTADELHVDSFISDATWRALSARYDTNQLVDTIDSVGAWTLHAGVVNSVGVEIEAGVPDRLPSGIVHGSAAKRTNIRLVGKEARIPPLEPKDWTPEQRKRFDPNGTGQRAANVFVTFVRNPPGDRLRSGTTGHILNSNTLTVRQRELLLMRIGVLCRSEYEWAAHSRLGRRSGGMNDADVARVIAGPGSGGGDPLETALLRATDELYEDDIVSDATWAVLAKSLDAKQLLDVLISVGGYRAVSMAINSAGVQLDANMADFRFPPSLR